MTSMGMSWRRIFIVRELPKNKIPGVEGGKGKGAIGEYLIYQQVP